jgi:hypothetical protein
MRLFLGARSLTKILLVDAKIAETIVALKAVQFAKEVGFLDVIFEEDAAHIISKISSIPPYLSKPRHFLESIHIEKQSLRTCNFTFAYREANSASHCFAKEVACTTIDLCWPEDIPISISNIIFREALCP